MCERCLTNEGKVYEKKMLWNEEEKRNWEGKNMQKMPNSLLAFSQGSATIIEIMDFKNVDRVGGPRVERK